MSETPFRIALLAIFILRAVPGFYFWRRVQSSGEKLDRSQEGPLIQFGMRIMAGLYGLGVIAWLVQPEWMAWSALWLPRLLRWLGVALAAAATLLVSWSLKTLGKNFTDTVVVRKDNELVTNGPYRFVRHPLYTAYFTMVAGVSLLMANWFPLAAGSVVLTLLVLRTKKEEERLLERHGEAYRDYMNSVGRFLPRLF